MQVHNTKVKLESNAIVKIRVKINDTKILFSPDSYLDDYCYFFNAKNCFHLIKLYSVFT